MGYETQPNQSSSMSIYLSVDGCLSHAQFGGQISLTLDNNDKAKFGSDDTSEPKLGLHMGMRIFVEVYLVCGSLNAVDLTV